MSSHHPSPSEGGPSSGSDRLKTFHLFPILPNELQDTIWDFAVVPRLIKFELVDLRSIINRRRDRDANRMLITSQRQNLLLVCKSAQEAVKRASGREYTLTLMERKNLPGYNSSHPPLLFHLVPDYDTIYLADIHDFEELAWHGYIQKKDSQGPTTGLTDIKSLALSGIVGQAYYSLDPWIATPGARTGIYVGPHRGRFVSAEITYHLRFFPGLEELILVSPPATKLSKLAGENEHRNSVERVVCKSPTECEERIVELASELERLLGSWSNQRLPLSEAEVLDGRPKVGLDLEPEYVSNWWLNPKVTLMREEDFNSRFRRKVLIV